MPTVPYAQLQVSVNGGGYQTGGIDVAVADVLTLRFVDTTGITQQLFEIYDYPTGFACPAGWSTDANGVYYYNTDFNPPNVTVTRWGKLMLRLTGNNGIKNGVYNPTDMVDEDTAIRCPSTAGFHSIGEFESDQFETGWPEEYKNDMDLAEAGGLSAPANPGDNYKVSYALNGALAWADEISVTAAEDALEIGATVSGTGHIRGEAGFSVYGLNTAVADTAMLRMTGDDVTVGDTANAGRVNAYSVNGHRAYVGGNLCFQVLAGGVEVKPAGAAVAGVGHVRLPEDGTVYGLDAAGPADTYIVGISNNDVLLGDVAKSANTKIRALTTAQAVIGANTELTVGAGYLSHSPSGATVSTTGTHRVHSDFALKARADDDDGDISLLALSGTSPNNFSVGEITDIANTYVKALTTVQSVIGANTEVTVGAGYLSHSAAGATVSTTGTHRVHSDFALKARADDDDGDISLLALSGTSPNDLTLGEITDIDTVYIKAKTDVITTIGANDEFIVGSGYVAHSAGGATVSTTGTHRVHSDFALKARADDDDGDISLMALSGTSGNDLTIGEATDIYDLFLKSSHYIYLDVGGNPITAIVPTGIEMANTLATPTIETATYGNHAGTDLVVKAGDCNYGYQAGDLYLKSGANGGSGTALSVHVIADGSTVYQAASVAGTLEHAWFGGATAAQQTVVGAKGGNVALTNLLTALANYGLIIDNTT